MEIKGQTGGNAKRSENRICFLFFRNILVRQKIYRKNTEIKYESFNDINGKNFKKEEPEEFDRDTDRKRKIKESKVSEASPAACRTENGCRSNGVIKERTHSAMEPNLLSSFRPVPPAGGTPADAQLLGDVF